MQIFKTQAGFPLPLGTLQKPEGINFALVTKHATSVTLVLYEIDKNEILTQIPLDPKINKTGDVWHIFIEMDSKQPIGYAYKIGGPSKGEKPHFFNGPHLMLDPYAKSVHSSNQWGAMSCENYHPVGLILPHTDFDWENDQSPQIHHNDLIIYEMHVRGFTKHISSQAKNPGTFLGVIEKIPHLVELGINAVELLPIQEFNEDEYRCLNPHIHEKLYQYWGYSSVNFFSPMNRYASNANPGLAINEFKSMVKALHKNGIAVILDIVLNHTSEGNAQGPVNSFKGIDSCIYYLFDKNGLLLNFTGCGNTFNTNYPVVQKFILDVLHYWVLEMHVDGFRFDLASVFRRGTHGEVLTYAPIIEAISEDPILSNTLLIAEPWDAAGLYDVGHFYPEKIRWSEWNARYRDTIRRFIKGTTNIKGKFASRIAGSEDIYGSRSPTSGINFIVSHDGFTLNDLVSYDQKHNLYNGENNHDGENNNESWNCGVEGSTNDLNIQLLRQRQMRNFHLALMVSQGIPMLLMGDEYGHTKKGNNNTWCHDNEINWFLWYSLSKNQGFYRYYRKLIEFRNRHEILRQGRFLTESDISWWDANGFKANWDKDTQFLAFTLFDKKFNKNLYCAFNAQNIPINVELPELPDQFHWHLVVNTANESPNDFYEKGEEPSIESKSLSMLPYSALLLEARR